MKNNDSYWMWVFSKVFFPKGIDDPVRLSSTIKGQVILITGASFGIGEAAAYQLSAAGAVVLLVGRTEERLIEVVEKIRDLGGLAYMYVADLSCVNQVDALSLQIKKNHSVIDVVISNAGKSIRRSMALSYNRLQDFERTMAINYLGPVRLLLQLLPPMLDRKNGQIINVSAVGVRLAPAPRWAAYHASKIAFDVWFRSAVPELNLQNIKTSSIYLPLVQTRMIEPTPHYQHVPSLSTHDAASLICKALIKQPKRIAPWWLYFAEIFSVIFWRPIEWLMRRLFLLTKDSPAASRVKEDESHHL